MALQHAHGRGRPAWTAAGSALAKVLLGSAALAVAAKIQVPFWPVPMTMQTLVVVLLGAGLGPRLGALAVLAYLAEGLAGLPVFAGPLGGLAVMSGPTAGFLAGFAPAAALTGWLAAHGGVRTAPRGFMTMLAGHVAVFIPGVAWLAALVGWEKAVMLGFVPFIVGTLVKSALATGLVLAARRP